MITFENIRTGEKVVFTGEQETNSRNAHMAAYLNASDLSPNAGVRGQDFGWRLAPEVIAEMDAVRQDYDTLERISKRLGVGIDDIRDFHILSYVADRSFAQDAKNARKHEPTSTDLEDDYRARVKAAKGNGIMDSAISTNQGETTVEYNEAAERGQKLAAQNSKAAAKADKSNDVQTAPAVEETPNKGVKPAEDKSSDTKK